MGTKHSGSSPCASCRLLRRRCVKDCIFAPYFPADEPHKFATVHKVFGASNVSKMLQDLSFHERADAVSSLVYEADARMRDPVYGCVRAISTMNNTMAHLKAELAIAKAEIVKLHQEKAVSNSNNSITSVVGMLEAELAIAKAEIVKLQQEKAFSKSNNSITAVAGTSNSVPQETTEMDHHNPYIICQPCVYHNGHPSIYPIYHYSSPSLDSAANPQVLWT